MRPPLLTILMVLYAAFGLGFAAWTVLGLGATVDSPFALPLPWPVMLLAAFVNGAIAAGIRCGVRATRAGAACLHALVALAAVGFTGKHVIDGDATAATFVEMAAKSSVHALLAGYWLRSRRVAAFFATGR